ncbi:Predicted kinase, aminoglycoside phosphotransferase (APT) family [Sphingobium faniae]|nr:Predicted kinase, aminoglycoside phosphotransferase (APT) family [Sphingobium faniae]
MSMTILPSSDRILRGMRTSLARIRKTEAISDFARDTLRVTDAMLGEILQRQDSDFYLSTYLQGRALLEGWNAASAPSGQVALQDLPSTVPPHTCYQQLGVWLGIISTRLADTIRAVEDLDGEYVQQVVAWEEALYGHRLKAAPEPEAADAPTPRIERDSLALYLEARGLTLLDFRRIVGGYQKDTLLFRAKDDSGLERDYVIRADKPDRFVNLDAGSIRDEYEIVRRVHAAGIPTAKPLWLESDAARLGMPFMVSDRVKGVTPGAVNHPHEMTEGELRSIAETLADIHLIPIDRFAGTCVEHWGARATLGENSRAAVEMWPRQPWAQAMTPSPTATSMLEWLRRNVPTSDRAPALVHTDYAPYNLMLHEGRVAAVLDWEGSRIGDPMEDLSFLLQCLGHRADPDKIKQYYSERIGSSIDEDALRYFDVYNSMKYVLGGFFAGTLYEKDESSAIQWGYLSLYSSWHGMIIHDRRLKSIHRHESQSAAAQC